MSAPFDTLQLARGFEAAGFPLDQASKMAEAVAQATIGADLATKRDLRELEQRLTIRLSAAMVVIAGLLFGALHYWPPAASSPTPPAASPAKPTVMLVADAQQEPPYSCRLLYDEQRKCAFGSCDPRTIERLKRECLRDGGRP